MWISTNHKQFIQDYINKLYKDFKYKDDNKNPCKKPKEMCDNCKNFCNEILEEEECKSYEQKNDCSCQQEMKNKFQSFLHQQFLSKFFHEFTIHKEPHSRGLLIYHGLGSGKTCTSLMIAKSIREASKVPLKINILIQARLEIDPWKKELFSPCGVISENKDNYKTQKAFYNLINKKYNVNILHYNAFNVLKEKTDEIDFNNSIIIVDETHNFLNTLRNISEKDRLKNPTFYLYSKIVTSKNSKLCLLSGTPIYNNPVELSYIFNMLTGNPKYMTINQDKFAEKYIQNSQIVNKNLLMNKLHGMVSYFKGASENAYAKKTQKMIKSPLTYYQDNIYSYLMNEANKMKHKHDEGTRILINNFARNRDRAMADLLLRYDKFMKTKEDDSENHFIVKILEVCNVALPKEIYDKYSKKDSAIKFLIDQKHKKKSQAIYDDLNAMNFFDIKKIENYSSKFINIYNKINNANGPVVVYSFFRELHGIKSFTEFLKAQGYKNAETDGPGENRFMVWTGERTPNAESLKEIYNQLDNADGSKIKVFCMTSAGAEGISLKSVREIHIMEPWWNYVLMKQIMGRGLRVCSHAHLKKENQKLDVFLYYGSKLELFMVDIALKKFKRNKKFEDALKISAIDCNLNEKRNKLDMPCYSYDTLNQGTKLNLNKYDDYNINLFKLIEKDGKKYYMDQTPMDNNTFKVFRYDGDINVFLKKRPTLIGFLIMKHEDDFKINFLRDTQQQIMELSNEQISEELKEISKKLDINIRGLNEDKVRELICEKVKLKLIEKEMFEE